MKNQAAGRDAKRFGWSYPQDMCSRQRHLYREGLATGCPARRDPLRAGNKLWIGQEVEWLTNVKEKSLLIGCQQRVQLLR